MDEKNNKLDKPMMILLQEYEVKLIEWALRKTKGNVAAASRELKINRTALVEKMRKYQIKRGSFIWGGKPSVKDDR